MIGPLRARHRRIFLVLSIGLPMLIVGGVIARVPLPITNAMGEFSHEYSDGEYRVFHENRDEWSDLGITIRVLESELEANHLLIDLQIESALSAPDVLLYWSDDRQINDSSANSAFLLGSIPGVGRHHFELPDIATDLGGGLFLYSLAHMRVIESMELPTRAQETEDG